MRNETKAVRTSGSMLPCRLRLIAGAHRLGFAGAHLFGGKLDGAHNILIAGAATDVAFETFANLSFGRVGVMLEQLVRGHNHARRTETTLQAMLFPEAYLDRVQVAFGSQPLNGGDFTAIGLDSKNGAGFYCFAIQQHHTCSTLRSVAPDMGTCKI